MTPARAALHRLGHTLRARRKALGVSATAAAQSALMSRVTWHRIEAGEPSVTLGAYLNAAAALGLTLEATGAAVPGTSAASVSASAAPAVALSPDAPAAIRLADHPQLARLAWQMPASATLTPDEALGLYEREWRHIDQAAMAEPERALLAQLLGHRGRLLV